MYSGGVNWKLYHTITVFDIFGLFKHPEVMIWKKRFDRNDLGKLDKLKGKPCLWTLNSYRSLFLIDV